MEAKKQRNRILLRALICLAIVAVLIAGVCAARYIAAKYTQSFTFDGNVYIEKYSDWDLDIIEHKAIQLEDGSYVLCVDSEDAEENEYNVLPGVDIPKDPQIYVYSLNSGSAYIYIEVVDTLYNNEIEYELESYWLKLDGVTGSNGGAVYVYAADFTDNGDRKPTLVNSESSATNTTGTELTTSDVEGIATTATPGTQMILNIIKNQTVYVSSSYEDNGTTGELAFYGYVAEASEGDDAADVFSNIFLSSATTTTTATDTD